MVGNQTSNRPNFTIASQAFAAGTVILRATVVFVFVMFSVVWSRKTLLHEYHLRGLHVRFGSRLDICAAKKACPFCPRKRTCAVQTGMSGLGQKRTSTIYSIISSTRACIAAGTLRPSAFAVFRL